MAPKNKKEPEIVVDNEIEHRITVLEVDKQRRDDRDKTWQKICITAVCGLGATIFQFGAYLYHNNVAVRAAADAFVKNVKE